MPAINMYDMPRLSIFKPEKGNDYKFFDRNIKEMFQVGGTDLHFHKYLGPYDQGDTNKDGPASPTQPQYSGDSLNERTIQDLLFLENRDRKYADDVYVVRGIYNVQDADFNLSQFGMFLQNDTLFLTVHLNDIVERIGRKPMAGDVIEFPHMKEDYSLDESIPIALKRYYYVVEDVNRAAEGFSQTWWPHLLRLKMKTMVDSQEFKDIIGDATTAGSVASYMSTYNREKTINDQIVAQAEADAPKSGFNYKQYYVAPIDERGNIRTDNVNDTDRVSSDKSVNAVIDTPAASHYGFYLDGDGVAPNGNPAGFGISFPTSNVDKGDYFLRTDYLPNRLFRFDGTRWVKIEDSVRITTTNNDSRANFKTSFVNNSTSSTINGLTVEQRQALTDALKPKADN